MQKARMCGQCVYDCYSLTETKEKIMSTATPSSTRIDLRVDPYKKSVISRAAALLGINITQFIIERVFPEAERIVAEDARTRLPKEEWMRFLAKLDEAPKDLPELRRLLREPSIFVKN
jgi:uncharacterized protein (DUF1778 family)